MDTALARKLDDAVEPLTQGETLTNEEQRKLCFDLFNSYWEDAATRGIEFDTLEATWERGGERVLVTDADGVVFLASDPAFNLAAQLLAADLNIVAGTCPAAVNAINDAQTLLAAVHFNGITHDKLSAAQATQANSLATTLDHYNNNLLC